jgi:general secretion pathway protein C
LKKLVSLANFAALTLLGLVLAYWSWAWLAPSAAARAPAAVDLPVKTSAAGGLFGGAKQAAASAASAVRLMGVVAASGGGGHAVLRLDSKKTVAVLQGEEVEPGLRLAEVHADHIVLERNGTLETLAWPEKSGK